MKTLLVVDDEKLIADGLKAMLAASFRERLRVECRYSAKEALALAAGNPVDILLTDINMPNRTGLELHEELRRFRPDIRVIYLTGYSDFEYARKALDQHAFAYVLKGEGDDVVIRTVERALHAPEEADAETPPAEKAETPEWIRRLHSHIRENLSQDLSLNRLADYCHFHPVYLSRTYRELTGMTLSDYIGSIRLEKAKELLRISRMSIGEIARLTGFATDNYFCRWFRKQTGESPQGYRKGKESTHEEGTRHG